MTRWALVIAIGIAAAIIAFAVRDLVHLIAVHTVWQTLDALSR